MSNPSAVHTRWIRANPEICDVLFSGGDPFLLLDDRIEHVLTRLRNGEEPIWGAGLFDDDPDNIALVPAGVMEGDEELEEDLSVEGFV